MYAHRIGGGLLLGTLVPAPVVGGVTFAAPKLASVHVFLAKGTDDFSAQVSFVAATRADIIPA